MILLIILTIVNIIVNTIILFSYDTRISDLEEIFWWNFERGKNEK